MAGIVQNIYLTVIDVRDAVRKWNGWKIDDAKLTPEFKNRIQKLILDNMEESVFGAGSVLTDAIPFISGGQKESILAWAKIVSGGPGAGAVSRFDGAKLLASVQRTDFNRKIEDVRKRMNQLLRLPFPQQGETSREEFFNERLTRLKRLDANVTSNFYRSICQHCGLQYLLFSRILLLGSQHAGHHQKLPIFEIPRRHSGGRGSDRVNTGS